jgi:hypothetical protein
MNLLRQARRGLAAAVFLGLWLCGQTCQAQVIFKELEDVPAPIGRDTVQTIEGQVAMPARAKPLAQYHRYYAAGSIHGRKVIVGVFVLATIDVRRNAAMPIKKLPHAFTTTVGNLPKVNDGGCNIVTIYFDVATQHLIQLRDTNAQDGPVSAACNGVA